MTLVVTVLAVLALSLSLRGIWLARRRLRHTTLVSAGTWARAAIAFWGLSLGASLFFDIPEEGRDALWYATALLALCPAIAVLGARRPGAAAWNTFVILPLLAVLGWPLLTLWAGGGEIRALRLETPQLIGFVLVLLMGAGNYIGTRFSLPAVMYVVSLCLLAGTVSAVAPPLVQGSAAARHLATICLGLAIVGARSVLKDPTFPNLNGSERAEATFDTALHSAPAGFDRLWADYRDTFGIVWAKRFQERLNGIALQQKWPARLTDAGIEWEADTDCDMSRDQVRERIDQTFRWLLRRFVDPPWIDARLNVSANDGRLG